MPPELHALLLNKPQPLLLKPNPRLTCRQLEPYPLRLPLKQAPGTLLWLNKLHKSLPNLLLKLRERLKWPPRVLLSHFRKSTRSTKA
jgi:hypothetical protein